MRKLSLALGLGLLLSVGGALPLATPAAACSAYCQAIPSVPPTPQVVVAPAPPPTALLTTVTAPAATPRVAAAPAPRPQIAATTHPWVLECRRSNGGVDGVTARAPRVNPTEQEIETMRLRHNCTPTQAVAAQAVAERAALDRQQALVALLNTSTPAAERRAAALAALPNVGFTTDQTAHIRAALEGPGTPEQQLAAALIRLRAIIAERALPPAS